MLHGLYIRYMLSSFESQDTKTEDTALPQWAVNPRLTGLRCLHCEHAWPLALQHAGCPACAQAGVQLLDQTVAFRRFRIEGRALKRQYQFEYSPDGTSRQMGAVLLRGSAVEYTHFADAKGALLMPPTGP